MELEGGAKEVLGWWTTVEGGTGTREPPEDNTGGMITDHRGIREG